MWHKDQQKKEVRLQPVNIYRIMMTIQVYHIVQHMMRQHVEGTTVGMLEGAMLSVIPDEDKVYLVKSQHWLKQSRWVIIGCQTHSHSSLEGLAEPLHQSITLQVVGHSQVMAGDKGGQTTAPMWTRPPFWRNIMRDSELGDPIPQEGMGTGFHSNPWERDDFRPKGNPDHTGEQVHVTSRWWKEAYQINMHLGESWVKDRNFLHLCQLMIMNLHQVTLKTGLCPCSKVMGSMHSETIHSSQKHGDKILEAAQDSKRKMTHHNGVAETHVLEGQAAGGQGSRDCIAEGSHVCWVFLNSSQLTIVQGKSHRRCDVHWWRMGRAGEIVSCLVVRSWSVHNILQELVKGWEVVPLTVWPQVWWMVECIQGAEVGVECRNASQPLTEVVCSMISSQQLMVKHSVVALC